MGGFLRWASVRECRLRAGGLSESVGETAALRHVQAAAHHLPRFGSAFHGLRVVRGVLPGLLLLITFARLALASLAEAATTCADTKNRRGVESNSACASVREDTPTQTYHRVVVDPAVIVFGTVAGVAVAALVVGRWWALALPFVVVPLVYLGVGRGWWGAGLGDGWEFA